MVLVISGLRLVLVLLVLKEPSVSKDLWVFGDIRVFRVFKVTRVFKDFKVTKDFRDYKVTKVSKDFRDSTRS